MELNQDILPDKKIIFKNIAPNYGVPSNYGVTSISIESNVIRDHKKLNNQQMNKIFDFI